MLFIQNSFENTCVIMGCRDVGVEVEKWRMEMFIKMHMTSLYYDDQLTRATTLPEMGRAQPETCLFQYGAPQNAQENEVL